MSKVILVEDEKRLAKMYRDIFEKNGHTIIPVETVSDALEKTKENNPDVVLLDILLPGETGILFLEGLRELNSDLSQIPVIAFSNYDDEETKKDAFELGVKEYLIKTEHTPAEILEKVEKYL